MLFTTAGIIPDSKASKFAYTETTHTMLSRSIISDPSKDAKATIVKQDCNTASLFSLSGLKN
jgi:hypothetical protein